MAISKGMPTEDAVALCYAMGMLHSGAYFEEIKALYDLLENSNVSYSYTLMEAFGM